MNPKNWTIAKALPYILIIAGIIGYAAAFIITEDKLKLASNPNFVPSCNLNPIISCGSVMKSAQANVFGFPNPFIGLGAFPIIGIIGVAMLAGAGFKRWFWLGLNAGLLFALGFVHWLFFESVYRIQALCPYCMAVWTVTIISFWYVCLYNLDQKHLRLPANLKPAGAWIRRHHLDILVLWLLIIAGLILKHFWYYYGRHI